MTMKILLAVDGSRHSLKAVKYLIRHARAYRDRPAVELIHVHPPVPRLPNMRLVVSAGWLRRYYEQEGAAALSRAKRLLDAARIKYTARTLIGEIGDTIAREARRTRSDLIVIGTRGMTAAKNLLLGSAATKVLHASTLPVMLVK